MTPAVQTGITFTSGLKLHYEGVLPVPLINSTIKYPMHLITDFRKEKKKKVSPFITYYLSFEY